MDKSKKKKFLISILALFIIYTLWLSFHLLRFKKYETPKPEGFPQEIEGVYHIHTIFSDGHKNPDEIAKFAARTSLDFIILTDHGNPNFESLASQGWKEGVLVLAGSELSVNRGHLVALGFRPSSSRFSPNAEQAVYQISTSNGFAIISHPYSKVRWSWGKFIDYSGIEIINANSMFKKNIHIWLPYLPALLIKPEYLLLKMLNKPENNMRKWDGLSRIHPIYGYFSTDAHLLYRPLLSFLRLHLLLEDSLSSDFETAKRQVFNSLKQGRFYNAVEAAAQARGFQFWCEKGNTLIPMGGTTVLDSPIFLSVKTPFPFTKEVHLLHNGNRIFISAKEMISYEATQPGTYRVEVYLKERSPLNKKIPWIVSNPIYLKEKEL